MNIIVLIDKKKCALIFEIYTYSSRFTYYDRVKKNHSLYDDP